MTGALWMVKSARRAAAGEDAVAAPGVAEPPIMWPEPPIIPWPFPFISGRPWTVNSSRPSV